MRLILAVIFLIIVVSVIGYFAYNQLISGDDNNQTNVLRWMGVVSVVFIAGLAAFVGSVIRYRIPKVISL